VSEGLSLPNGHKEAHALLPVNNAAAGIPHGSLSATKESLDTLFSSIVYAPIFLVQAVVPHMPRGSRVINIGSIASKLGMAPVGTYGAAKAALDALTYSMAMELGRSHGITINTVSPGPVDTDALPKEQAERINQMLVPLTRAEERVGTTGDIADAVLLLASENSRWITGQVISVSGGITGG
jgi:NAD(P)-dependent dehydrogenase (short-subunit alcohol dehydrogenase family)